MEEKPLAALLLMIPHSSQIEFQASRWLLHGF